MQEALAPALDLPRRCIGVGEDCLAQRAGGAGGFSRLQVPPNLVVAELALLLVLKSDAEVLERFRYFQLAELLDFRLQIVLVHCTCTSENVMRSLPNKEN